MGQETQPQGAINTRPKWKDLLLWAILAALLLQLGENYLLKRTVWQRLDKVETDLRQIERELRPGPGGK